MPKKKMSREEAQKIIEKGGSKEPKDVLVKEVKQLLLGFQKDVKTLLAEKGVDYSCEH